MAQRLATEYVNATLQMTEFQMNQFLLTADTCYISHRVKVVGGGEQVIVLEETGEKKCASRLRIDGEFTGVRYPAVSLIRILTMRSVSCLLPIKARGLLTEFMKALPWYITMNAARYAGFQN